MLTLFCAHYHLHMSNLELVTFAPSGWFGILITCSHFKSLDQLCVYSFFFLSRSIQSCSNVLIINRTHHHALHIAADILWGIFSIWISLTVSISGWQRFYLLHVFHNTNDDSSRFDKTTKPKIK